MRGKSLSSLKVILSGQLVTSRTETLEEYLKGRVETLAVIGIVSPYSPIPGRCTVYGKGKINREFKLAGYHINNMSPYKQPLLFISFLVYFVTIFYAALRLKEKFDCFIGVSCFSAFVGVLLKKIKIVRNLVYYSIDYYIMPSRFCFNTLTITAFRFVDRFCVRNSDMVWHISRYIPDARNRYAGINKDSYRHVVAPLTYASRFQRFKPIEETEPCTIGFVGTLTKNQGLQLLVEGLPAVIREIPGIKVRIIGKGPYENELKRAVADANLDDYFIFYGFIKDDEKVLDILSNCSIGVALWSSEDDNNIKYADTGKPKLYAFCGIPIIITNSALSVAEEIKRRRAGVSIDYDPAELAKAVIDMFNDTPKLKQYKDNVREFARDYITDTVFDDVFQKTLQNLN